eukprot:93882-Amphidinium_carterae.1
MARHQAGCQSADGVGGAVDLLMDAARISFTEGSYIDLQKSTGFRTKRGRVLSDHAFKPTRSSRVPQTTLQIW